MKLIFSKDEREIKAGDIVLISFPRTNTHSKNIIVSNDTSYYLVCLDTGDVIMSKSGQYFCSIGKLMDAVNAEYTFVKVYSNKSVTIQV